MKKTNKNNSTSYQNLNDPIAGQINLTSHKIAVEIRPKQGSDMYFNIYILDDIKVLPLSKASYDTSLPLLKLKDFSVEITPSAPGIQQNVSVEPHVFTEADKSLTLTINNTQSRAVI